mmetsp:Transcript_10622/g.31952  ORF Transcript_10622/g.31952 Transcript_10622/m.31952 type:complete len:141 (+) Transcript_10622:64-486(+)
MVALLRLLCVAAAAQALSVVQRPVTQKRTCARRMTMLDANFVTGAAVSLAGFGTGIAIAYFAEKQITRAEDRGADTLSDTTRAKMSAMFMEDEVMPVAGLDETVRKMEEALAAARGEELPKEGETSKEDEELKQKLDDGW